MGRARHILVVDDDDDFRSVLREVLENEGCVVSEAGDGRAALDALRTFVPDLIFLDLTMPGMNGWELYAELQRHPVHALIRIALLSATEGEGPMGRMHVLHKPVDLPTLLRLLHALAEPETPSNAPRSMRDA